MTNDFGQLDAQDEMCSLALVSSVEVTTEEHTMAKVIHSNGKLGSFANTVRLLANLAAQCKRDAKTFQDERMQYNMDGKAFAFRLSARSMAFSCQLWGENIANHSAVSHE
jgi:hypothetical protein